MIKAAMIGGTASALTGGKFANGAITGAFSRALNDEVQEEAQEDKPPKLFNDKRFRLALERALGTTGRDVRVGKSALGLAIFSDGDGGYNFGEYPNNVPNRSVLRGIETIGGFGAQAIVGAVAVVIVRSPFERNQQIIDGSTSFKDLSRQLEAPVIVTSVRADIFIFNGDLNPVKL